MKLKDKELYSDKDEVDFDVKIVQEENTEKESPLKPQPPPAVTITPKNKVRPPYNLTSGNGFKKRVLDESDNEDDFISGLTQPGFSKDILVKKVARKASTPRGKMGSSRIRGRGRGHGRG